MKERGDMTKRRLERGPKREELFLPQYVLRSWEGRECKASGRTWLWGGSSSISTREKGQVLCTSKKGQNLTEER